MAHEDFIKGLEGVLAAQSSICFIDGAAGRLTYRGIDIQDLAENSTFEETAYFLLFGHLPKQSELDAFVGQLQNEREVPTEIYTLLRTLPSTATPMEVLRTATSALSAYDPDGHDNSDAANVRKAVRLIAQMTTLTTAYDRIRRGLEPIKPDPSLSMAESFLYGLTGEKPHPSSARVFDVCLILHADHELNASTFAARVIASTLSDVHAAVTGAIGALAGSLHGGANQRVLEMLLEIGELDKVEAYVDNLFANKKNHGLRAPRLSHDGPAGNRPAQVCQAAWRRCRQHEVVRDGRAHRAVGLCAQKALPERGFLLGAGVLHAQHPGGFVHADFCVQPHFGLGGTHHRAVA